jgi:hypothetical protein
MAEPIQGPAGRPTLYEIRWIHGKREGCCWIRGVSEDDVITDFQENAGFYGAPRQRALVVSAVLCDRGERRLHARAA